MTNTIRFPSLLALTAIALYAIVDPLNFGVGLPERAAYVLLLGFAALAGVTSLRSASASRASWTFAAVWLLAVAVLTLPALTQTTIYPVYIAGDSLSLLLPVVFLVAGWGAPGLFSRRSLYLIAPALFAAMLLAWVAGRAGNRFEPPMTLLTAISWWGFGAARGLPRRAVGAIAVLLIGLLALESGQRTALLIWGACGAFVIWQMTATPRLKILLVLASAVFGAALLGTAARDIALESLSGYRVVAASQQDEEDASLLARVTEGQDVLTTMARDGTWLNWLAGFGSGATYTPKLSYLSRNVTAEGRVHNVHIGPLLILFRYGVFGLGLYLLLLANLLQTMLGRDRQPFSSDLRLFAFCTGAYLVEGLMFNVLVDPAFAFALAGFLFHRAAQHR